MINNLAFFYRAKQRVTINPAIPFQHGILKLLQTTLKQILENHISMKLLIIIVKIYQNLCDATVPREKLVTLNSSMNKKRKQKK